MSHASEALRNVAFLGHAGSGKTALVDAIALHTRVVNRLGSVADGTSISDTEFEEKERKQTLSLHLFQFPLGSIRLNAIDTPGHPDFAAEAIAAMDVVETAVLCVNAAAPLTFHARQLFRQAGEVGIGRAIVVTHLDQENTSFQEVVDELRAVFGHAVCPVTYPNGSGSKFTVVHDVTHDEGPDAPRYHDMIEEDEAEVDDKVMQHLLENGHLRQDEFEANIRRAIARGKLIPVFAVCPNRGLGLEQLMEFVTLHFPSPICFGGHGADRVGTTTWGELVEPELRGPFAAKVFKVVSDPYVGRLSFLRCFRGTLKKDDSFLDVRSGKLVKAAHLHEVLGKESREIQQVVPGDLFVLGKVEDLAVGDTITAEHAALQFPQAAFPKPTHARHVWPKSRNDEQRIGHALERLAAEDPTLDVHRDPMTGEILVTGMSQLHLDVQLQRMHRRHQVEVEQGLPAIPYRETVTAAAEGHHRHKKQTGGRGQFAEVIVRLAPKPQGEGFAFLDSVTGGSVPRQFIPEVEKGARRFLLRGALAGFPVVDVQFELYDGKSHAVDSDAMSFQVAGERAFHDGYLKAKPILLEPIMDVEIRMPERFTGDVASHLSGARGRLTGMETSDGMQVIRAQVPLATMLEYNSQLRSITAGEGTFTMTLGHYEAVPPHLQAEIVRNRKAIVEEHLVANH